MAQGKPDDGIEFIGKTSCSFDLTSKRATKKTTIVLDEDSKMYPKSTINHKKLRGQSTNSSSRRERTSPATMPARVDGAAQRPQMGGGTTRRVNETPRPGPSKPRSNSQSTPNKKQGSKGLPAQADIIILSSDDDEIVEVTRVEPKRNTPPVSQVPRPQKRSHSPMRLLSSPRNVKRRKPETEQEFTSEEEEYEGMLPFAQWKPLPDGSGKLDVNDELAALTLDDAPPPLPLKRNMRPTGREYRLPRAPRPSNSKTVIYNWDLLNACDVGRRPYPKRVDTNTTKRCHVFSNRSPTNYKTTYLKDSAGAVGTIAQHRGHVALGSAVSGGGPDVDNEVPDDYNKSGSLIVWEENSPPLLLYGHQRAIRHVTKPCTKHYSVNDVKFAPHGNALVSAGNDRKVHIWRNWGVRPVGQNYSEEELHDLQEENEDDDSDTEEFNDHLYDIPPKQLLFKPDSRETILAIAERDITICRNLTLNNTTRLSIFRRSACNALAMVWGIGPTEGYIFATSEPDNHNAWKGSHLMFHAENTRGKDSRIELKEADDEPGDAITLSPDGKTLALFTCTSTTNKMRLYDVATKSSKPYRTLNLPSFVLGLVDNEDDWSAAVNSASYSPDGIYLAVARNDNTVHMYDSRMLERGTLHEFEHDGPSRVSPGKSSFGVLGAQWLESPSSNRLGLVTGGNDGCVRLWSPLLANDDRKNGRVLLEAAADIGSISLGDASKGEHELVAGDSAGGVHIVDRMNLSLLL
ncbi:hypothetical protein AAF712_007841 [Marasmius tenuissimus]|uniref:WD40 repeat-like protein n=1 Tax=Marasmius tenuissimus TaxID=585030 RepID=A0ABR2ZU99_9AGAR